MNDIFGALGMLGNYEQRKVYHFEDKDVVVDTCSVTDSEDPYETAVSHSDYNGGKWVIVETYATKDLSKIGHNKWVKTMTSKKLPKDLKDVGGCFFAKALRSIDENGMVFKKSAKNSKKGKAKNATVRNSRKNS